MSDYNKKNRSTSDRETKKFPGMDKSAGKDRAKRNIEKKNTSKDKNGSGSTQGQGKKNGFKPEDGKRRTPAEKALSIEAKNNIADKVTATGEEKKVTRSKGLCPVADRCGGCQYQGISYEQQLEMKQTEVRKLLKPLGTVAPILGMENPLHYRNKVHAVFSYTRKHEIVSGIYEENSHRVVPVRSCQIEDAKADEIIQDIREMLPSFKIKVYDEDTGYGLFRHVLIRTGYYTGQILVVLVLASPILPSRNNFVKALVKKHPEITSIVINVNDKRTSMVLGDKETVIYGKGYIEDKIGDCTFRISPKSFYQVNPVQTQNLYAKALELAELTGNERVIDAYCGTGTIGILAAEKAKEVIGVELNKDAVKDAITNAKANGRKNIWFYQKDAGEFLVQMASQGEKADVIIMDPPRAGSSEDFIKSIGVLAPERVVYVSCNPETLARDVKLLKKQGYQPQGFWPYDMFPYTTHVETVCLLSKLSGAKNTIDVKVDMDELDVTSAETKATYEEIKAYVLP